MTMTVHECYGPQILYVSTMADRAFAANQWRLVLLTRPEFNGLAERMKHCCSSKVSSPSLFPFALSDLNPAVPMVWSG